MANAMNLTNAAAFRAFVEKFADTLISELHFGAPSLQLFTAHEGVKGKKILTQLVLGQSLVRKYSKSFEPTEAFSFTPRELAIAMAKVDMEMTPKDLEDTYLGMFRQNGQLNPEDLPFERYIFNDILMKIKEEMEVTAWQGVAAASPAAGAVLNVLTDGIMHLLGDAATATTITPITTGALTSANMVEKVELVYSGIGKAYKATNVDIFCSVNDRAKYVASYRDAYGKYVALDNNRVPFDLGPATLHFLPGVPDGAIVVTPRSNLHYGYDGALDHTTFRVKDQIRSMQFAMDLNVGFQIGILNDRAIRVNDVV